MMNKYHTYFVFWMAGNALGTIDIGNLTFRTQSTGELLVQDAICQAQSKNSNAVVVNICKLD